MRTLDRHDRYDIDEWTAWLVAHGIDINDTVKIHLLSGSMYTVTVMVRDADGRPMVDATGDDILTQQIHGRLQVGPPPFRKNRVRRLRHRLPFAMQHPVWWLRHRMHR